MANSERRSGYRRRRENLLDDVADRANLRRDVVEDVLSAFFDISAERLLNERRLILTDLLSVGVIRTKNGIRPEPHLQFRAKVALGMRKLLQRMEDEPELIVNRDNWRELARKSAGRNPAAPSLGLSQILQDDDEDF